MDDDQIERVRRALRRRPTVTVYRRTRDTIRGRARGTGSRSGLRRLPARLMRRGSPD